MPQPRRSRSVTLRLSISWRRMERRAITVLGASQHNLTPTLTSTLTRRLTEQRVTVPTSG